MTILYAMLSREIYDKLQTDLLLHVPVAYSYYYVVAVCVVAYSCDLARVPWVTASSLDAAAHSCYSSWASWSSWVAVGLLAVQAPTSSAAKEVHFVASMRYIVEVVQHRNYHNCHTFPRFHRHLSILNSLYMRLKLLSILF